MNDWKLGENAAPAFRFVAYSQAVVFVAEGEKKQKTNLEIASLPTLIQL